MLNAGGNIVLYGDMDYLSIHAKMKISKMILVASPPPIYRMGVHGEDGFHIGLDTIFMLLPESTCHDAAQTLFPFDIQITYWITGYWQSGHGKDVEHMKNQTEGKSVEKSPGHKELEKL